MNHIKAMFENEDALATVQSDVNDYLEKFSSQREEWEDVWEVADYMIRCAQNRTLAASEKTVGQNPVFEDGEQAQTGSTLFFKLYRQLSCQLAAVALSGDRPFSYEPVTNPEVWGSDEEGRAMAGQANTLARWTMKADKFRAKFIKYCHSLKKYGNVPVWFYQKYTEGEVSSSEPILEMQELNGVLQPVRVGSKPIRKKAVKENWPTFKVLSPDAVYADALIGDLQRQECVIVTSVEPMSVILQRGRDKEYDMDQVRKITDGHKWDGTSYAEEKTKRIENAGQSMPQQATDQYAIFDVFMRLQIDGDDLAKDDKLFDVEPKLYWLTIVGTNPKSGVCVRFARNEDPDDEVPVYMMHSLPDDDDFLYHISESQVARSNYSVECTIKNQMIDNNSCVNHPPLIELEGAIRGTDRQFKPNARWVADSVDAAKEFSVRDLSQHNMALLEYIKTDTKEALSTTSNVLGEAYGGRTSALEASNAYRNAVQPHMVTIEYNLDEFFTVYGRKMISLWRKYAKPGQVVAITDEFEIKKVEPKALYGEFDIEVNAVGQFEDDVVVTQQLYELLQISAQNPQIAAQIDFGEFMKEIMRRRKGIPYTRIIKKTMEFDSRLAARLENQALLSGTQTPTHDGENDEVHLQVHEAERLRYKGIEDEVPAVTFLDQHIAEHKLKTQQSRPAGGEVEEAEPTGGAEAIGGAMGGMMGGGTGSNVTGGAGAGVPPAIE